MKSIYSGVTYLFFTFFLSAHHAAICQAKPLNYQIESREFLQAIRHKENTDQYVKIFNDCTLDQLNGQISTDHQKLAFWINIYNAYIQIILSKNPEKYDDRSTFFKEKQIKIGGQLFSFEDIEHGILRRSQHPFFLGYFTRLFPGKTEKMLRVGKRNWRIHFALNCGAKSCPPVAIYDPDRIESQLDTSTKNYLQKFSDYDSTNKLAYVSSLFSWFRGDFGGLTGIKDILIHNTIIPDKNVRLKISEYDWTLDLGNFVDL